MAYSFHFSILQRCLRKLSFSGNPSAFRTPAGGCNSFFSYIILILPQRAVRQDVCRQIYVSDLHYPFELYPDADPGIPASVDGLRDADNNDL